MYIGLQSYIEFLSSGQQDLSHFTKFTVTYLSISVFTYLNMICKCVFNFLLTISCFKILIVALESVQTEIASKDTKGSSKIRFFYHSPSKNVVSKIINSASMVILGITFYLVDLQDIKAPLYISAYPVVDYISSEYVT